MCRALGQTDAKSKTVAAQPVVLKALAKLMHDFAFGGQQNADAVETILSAIPRLPLSHDNQAWRFYTVPAADREKSWPGLPAYMPSEATGNRDLGAYDHAANLMRFGAKHNDIYPALADYFRWHPRLPPRPPRPERKLQVVVDSTMTAA